MTLKAVAFDVDGTLYPNSSMVWRSVRLALANPFLLKALERARIELRDHPDHVPDVHGAQADIVARILKIPTSQARDRIERTIYTQWYKVFRKIKPYEGLVPLIRRLKDAGFKLAVMSDFPIRDRLQSLGLDGWWDLSFSSEETGWLKPHPQPFLKIAETFQLTPGEILYVGNSMTYDVAGARAAGMPCAHLCRPGSAASSAVLNFHHYQQLEDFLFPRSVP